MNDYNWYDLENLPLENRFPDSASGYQEWVTGAANFPFATSQLALQWLDNLRNAPPTMNICPRVFVSHRQADKDNALRIARLSWEENFDYWIDVIDLDIHRNQQVKNLQAKLGRLLTSFEEAVLIAAIIEMAIHNCTHVLAAMTSNTVGSQWVPYEYGRVKDKTISGASCWWDWTSLASVNLPEYLHLADVHIDESQIRAWLQTELAKVAGCSARTQTSWSGAVTTILPTG